jgi:hypothetical protein
MRTSRPARRQPVRRVAGVPGSHTDVRLSAGALAESKDAVPRPEAMLDVDPPDDQELPSRLRRALLSMFKKVGAWSVLTAVGAAVGAVVGFYFSDRMADIEENAQTSERLDQAQEMLRSADLGDQLTGIAELQRLAEDKSTEVRRIAVDRIATFIRLNAKVNDSACGTQAVVGVAGPALMAIGKLNNGDIGTVNLSATCMEGVKISDANLSGVNFTNTNLRGANFIEVDLSRVRFDLADLTGTEFILVDLTSAVFCFTDISAAEFRSGSFVDTALDERQNAAIVHRSIDLSRLDEC